MSDIITIYVDNMLIDMDRNLFEDILFAAINHENDRDYVESPIIYKCEDIIASLNKEAGDKS